MWMQMEKILTLFIEYLLWCKFYAKNGIFSIFLQKFEIIIVYILSIQLLCYNMAAAAASEEKKCILDCQFSNTVMYSKFYYTKYNDGVEVNMFDGSVPLFACETYYKSQPCNLCDGSYYRGGLDCWCDPYGMEYVECKCDPDQLYHIWHMIVSIKSEKHSDKAITSPKDSVYIINIVSGKFPLDDLENIRARNGEYQQTTFSIYETMEIDLNLVQLLKTAVADSYRSYCDRAHSNYFTSFDGIAKRESYYKTFSDIFKKYLFYVPIEEQKKPNSHVGKKKKNTK